MPETWPSLLESVGAFDPPDDLRQRVEQRRNREAAAAPRRLRVSRVLIGVVAATAGVAAVVLMLALAAHSRHAPAPRSVASQAQAVSIAKGDGFTVQLGSPGIHPLTCTRKGLDFGTIAQGTRPAARAIEPRYVLSITDRKLHPLRDGNNGPTNGGILLLLALPSRAAAKRCAAAGIYGAQHRIAAVTQQGQTPGATLPYTMFSAVTVDINPHGAKAAGFIRGTTGEFDTYMAQGHVLAIGQTSNETQATIAEADLRQLLSQIAD
jgi:hypothetical protein